MVFRQIFNALSLRERYLLALFVWALLLIWLLYAVEDVQRSFDRFSDQKETIATFESEIQQADEAEAMLLEARSGLDSSRTFSSAQLVGKLDSLARLNEVSSFDISTPSTEETQLFSFHTVRLSIKRTRISELIRFDQAVKKHSPYIALGEFQVSANRRDPRYLDAVFELISFELKEEALNE
jgi:hypothetical protein